MGIVYCWARKLTRIGLLMSAFTLTACPVGNWSFVPEHWTPLVPEARSASDPHSVIVTVDGTNFLIPPACLPGSTAASNEREATAAPGGFEYASSYACALAPGGDGIELAGMSGTEIVSASRDGESLVVSRVWASHFKIYLRFAS